MEVLHALVLGAASILAFCFFKFPYFLQDCMYLRRILEVRSRRMKFREKTPFYSILECFLDAVQKHPQKAFILFEDQVHSYLQVDQDSNRLAQALQGHAGSTVALFLDNEPALVWTWLGLLKLGCPVSMLNTNIRKRSFLHCFRCCGASVLVAAAEHREAVCEVLPDLLAEDVCVYILGDTGGVKGLHNLSEKIQQSPNTPVPPSLRHNITMSSTALFIYTSGTTEQHIGNPEREIDQCMQKPKESIAGLPKATLISQDKIWSATFFPYLAGIKTDDVIYVALPLYHAAGLLIGLAGAIERGITLALRRKFSVSQFWADCRRYDVTVIQYIGEIMRFLCNTPKTETDRQHKVRLAIGNGLRADVWKEFQSRFGSVDIREFYAASDGNLSFINYVGKVGAAGRVNFYQKKMFPHALIHFDPEREEPVRDRNGLCVPVPTGETGLFVVKITNLAPFAGYAGNPEQTEKKRLRNVFQQGDVYFNSGDLLRMDRDDFIYFQDRIGDTFRWKGENVATMDVSNVLTLLDFIEDANVYGVEVPGHEGRTGMAAVTLKEGREFESEEAFVHVCNYLPVYARPRFIRILESMELTGTFKQVKGTLVKEGFNPKVIPQPLYVLQESSHSYVPLTLSYYSSILTGKIRL